MSESKSEQELWHTWFENQCGDANCEAVRLKAALLVLRGVKDDHKYYARVVTVGKEEIEGRDK